MSTAQRLVIRPIQETDFDSVNTIIESCVMGWNLPERVKRLSLSSYLYHAHDLDHFEIVLAATSGGEITGVAAWESANASDLPKYKSGMLLHGLYISPQFQSQGIGGLLINSALDAVHAQSMDGLLVKAQADAIGFFQSHGFINLPIENKKRDYPHRWWRPT